MVVNVGGEALKRRREGELANKMMRMTMKKTTLKRRKREATRTKEQDINIGGQQVKKHLQSMWTDKILVFAQIIAHAIQ